MAGATRSENNTRAWWFLAPALVLVGVFFFLPVAASLLLSLTDFDIYAIADAANTRFVGLRNYLALLDNPVFWTAVKNTFYFALVGGPLTVAVSLGAALLVNARVVRFKSFFRTVFFVPFVTTLVAVAIVWKYLYHPQYGLLNYVLSWFGLGPVSWLGDPSWAMPSIILMAVWKNFGYNMLIFIAGLQNIPTELYEAAYIDGAGPVRRFWNVTLPMLAAGLDPIDAAGVSVAVHAAAGLLAEQRIGTAGVLASDIAGLLPEAMTVLRGGGPKA